MPHPGVLGLLQTPQQDFSQGHDSEVFPVAGNAVSDKRYLVLPRVWRSVHRGILDSSLKVPGRLL